MTFDEWLDAAIACDEKFEGMGIERPKLLKLVRAYRKLTKGWITKEIRELEATLMGKD